MATRKAKANSIMPSFDDAKWRAQEDMRTLTRAKEIEADRARMAAAQKEVQAEMKKLQSVSKKPMVHK